MNRLSLSYQRVLPALRQQSYYSTSHVTPAVVSATTLPYRGVVEDWKEAPRGQSTDEDLVQKASKLGLGLSTLDLCHLQDSRSSPANVSSSNVVYVLDGYKIKIIDGSSSAAPLGYVLEDVSGPAIEEIEPYNREINECPVTPAIQDPTALPTTPQVEPSTREELRAIPQMGPYSFVSGGLTLLLLLLSAGNLPTRRLFYD